MSKWNSRRAVLNHFDKIYYHQEQVLSHCKTVLDMIGNTHPEITKAVERIAQMEALTQEITSQVKQQSLK